MAPPPGSWIYDCVGPVRALVALARGEAATVNLAPGEIGARAVATQAALLGSAREDGAARPVEETATTSM